MEDWCLELVTVDEERSTVQFTHFSVQNFLQEGPFSLNDENMIAATCLAFLNLDIFASSQHNNDQKLEDRGPEFHLLEYSARYWAIRGKRCGQPGFEQLAVDLSRSEHHLACTTPVAGYSDCPPDECYRLSARRLSSLHVIALFGLVQLIDVILQQPGADVDVKDSQGQTPIIYAAKKGHDAVVKVLARKGAQIGLKDDTHRRSALGWATLNGHTPVVRWLLSQKDDVDINSFDYQHSTPLHLAFERHHYDIADLLVQRGASLSLLDQWQRLHAQPAISGSTIVNLADYVKDRALSKPIPQGGQARVSVFRKHSGTVAFHVGNDIRIQSG